MTELTDYQGLAVRLTTERWRHILDHPKLSDMREAIALTLSCSGGVHIGLSITAVTDGGSVGIV